MLRGFGSSESNSSTARGSGAVRSSTSGPIILNGCGSTDVSEKRRPFSGSHGPANDASTTSLTRGRGYSRGKEALDSSAAKDYGGNDGNKAVLSGKTVPDTPQVGMVRNCDAGGDSTVKRPRQRRKVRFLSSVWGRCPPTIVFEYTVACGAPQRSLIRALPEGTEEEGTENGQPDQPVRVYYRHTRDVHQYNAVINTLRRAGFIEDQTEGDVTGLGKWTLLWGSQPSPELLRTFSEFQSTNHFPSSWQLGRKDLLWRNVARMRGRWGTEFDIMPQSFTLPQDYDDWEAVRNQNPSSLWIWKPVSSSCGRGIRVLSAQLQPGMAQVLSRKSGVVQQYVANPLLIQGFKFDMRIYVVVTSYDPLKVYLNDEGLVRFATEQFSTNLDSLRCRTMHLTNYSVNKLSSAYVHNFDGRPDAAGNMPCAEAAAAAGRQSVSGEWEDPLDGSDDDEGGGGKGGAAGPSKWSLDELRQWFAKEGWDWSVCKERMIDLIIKTLIAVEPIIVSSWHRGMGVRGDPKGRSGPKPSQSCFEVYGFDILLDDELKPWLLEVNVSPSLSSSSPLDKRIKTQLVADTLTLLGLVPKPLGPDGNRQPRDKGFGSPSRSSIVSSGDPLANIGESGWHTILDAHDEGSRTGALERIFPTEQNAAQYADYFVTKRHGNQVLQKWMMSGGPAIFRPNSGIRLPKWIPKQVSFDHA